MNQKTEHPYLRGGWALRMPEPVPDVNPADEAVARLRRRMVGGSAGTVRGGDGTSGNDGKDGGAGGDGSSGSNGSSGASGSSGGDGVSGPLGPAGAAATASVAASAATSASTANTKIDGASISAVCNGDGTITVTLTWGS